MPVAFDRIGDLCEARARPVGVVNLLGGDLVQLSDEVTRLCLRLVQKLLGDLLGLFERKGLTSMIANTRNPSLASPLCWPRNLH